MPKCPLFSLMPTKEEDDIILCMDINVNNQLLMSNTVCLFNILASNPYIKQIPKITKVIIPSTEVVNAM